jgi:uncharacterized membrane protein YhaH (DUF805 family)
VNLPRFLNYFSFVAVALVQIVTGFVFQKIPHFYKGIYQMDLPGKPLPDITLFVLRCSDSGLSEWVALSLGIFYLGALSFLERDDRRRAYLPVCLIAIMTFCWLQLLVTFIALTMPQIPLID